jgi:Restriction endonuclease
MHDTQNVTVQQNVRIRPLSGGRPREIDVLLQASVEGQPVQIAFECKNERKPVGAELIDAFVGKLQHVGLPVQSSIFISPAGYTRGARERARAAGVRLLLLTGLTQDRLRAALVGAFQCVVYLLPVCNTWKFTSDIEAIDSPADLNCFYDELGELAGDVGDLVWRAWHEGRIPTTLGKHTVYLQLPVGWRHIVRGRSSIPFSLAAEVQIHAIAVGYRGESRHHDLVNVETMKEEKRQVNAHFPATLAPIKLGPFRSEDELAAIDQAHPAPISSTLSHSLRPVSRRRSRWPLVVSCGGPGECDKAQRHQSCA